MEIFKREYTYDEFGRMTEKGRRKNDGSYDFVYKTVYTDVYTTLPQTYTLTKGDSELLRSDYTYDSCGNMTQWIQKIQGTKCGDRLYTYDKLNHLKTMKNSMTNRDYLFRYDENGRMERVRSFIQSGGAYVGEDQTYTYTNGRMTKLSRVSFARNSRPDENTVLTDDDITSASMVEYEYDAYGNRVKRTRAGEAEKTYSYVRGNLLSNANGAKYYYDSNGVRFQKQVNGETTNYYLDGSKFLGELRTKKEGESEKKTDLRYFYDANGICGMRCGDKDYSYVCDAEGNVVLLMQDDKIEARYEYDVYGNCTVRDGNGLLKTESEFIGNINPFRWKGHYYDAETGFYYIEGSYYDPETGRYLNACSVATIIDNPFSDYSLDRNGIMCDNILELLPYMYAIYTTQELSADPDYILSHEVNWLAWLGVVVWIAFAVAFIVGGVFMASMMIPMIPGIALATGTGILSFLAINFVEQGVSNNWNVKAIDASELCFSGLKGFIIGLVSGMFSEIAGEYMKFFGTLYGYSLAAMKVGGRSIGSLFAYLGGAKTIASVIGFTAKTIGAIAGGMIANEVANYPFGYDPTTEENTTESRNGLLLSWLLEILGKILEGKVPKWIKT